MRLDGCAVPVEHVRPSARDHGAIVVHPVLSNPCPICHVLVLPHDPSDLSVLEPVQPLKSVRIHDAAGLRQQRIHLQLLSVRFAFSGIGLMIQLWGRVEVEAQDALTRQRCFREGTPFDPALRHPASDIPERLAARKREAKQRLAEPTAHLVRRAVHLLEVVASFLPRHWRERDEPILINAVDGLSDGLVERREAALRVLGRHHPRLRKEVAWVRLIEEVEGKDVGVPLKGLRQDLPVIEDVCESGGLQVEQPPVRGPRGKAQLVLVPLVLLTVPQGVDALLPRQSLERLGDWHWELRPPDVVADEATKRRILQHVHARNVNRQAVEELQDFVHKFVSEVRLNPIRRPPRQSLATVVRADDILVELDQRVHAMVRRCFNKGFQLLHIARIVHVHATHWRGRQNPWHHGTQPDQVYTCRRQLL
mmetsp:Transcript_101885/g.263312  ORF Transcript_101885/g.263312 Transcript_101885/m.263312 type:complete len:422 (+) Transcript_101885:1106-2371(+)